MRKMKVGQTKGQRMTVVVIGLVVLFLVLYDLFALFFLGVDCTISVVLNRFAFQAHPLIVFCLGMVIGGLVVHFFKWKPNNKVNS